MSQMNDIAVIGLGRMGSGMARRMVSHGLCVAGYDLTVESKPQEKEPYTRYGSLSDAIRSLKKPSLVLMALPAGPTIDYMLYEILRNTQPSSFIIDAGNSHFEDSIRRGRAILGGNNYVDIGISGGVSGERLGYSLMIGPTVEDRKLLRVIEALSADTASGRAYAFLGGLGAGHYTKIVHNGVEYALMQLIAETIELLSTTFSCSEMADVIDEWNSLDQNCYLLEITANILRKKSEVAGISLLERIQDRVEHNGTGAWAVAAALRSSRALPIIGTAVVMRLLSPLKPSTAVSQECPVNNLISLDKIHRAMNYAFQLTYIEGVSEVIAGAHDYKWTLNSENLKNVWGYGAIIRSYLSQDVRLYRDRGESSIDQQPKNQIDKRNLDDIFSLIEWSILNKIPVPCYQSTVWTVTNGVTKNLSCRLIQLQRDYFGGHGFYLKSELERSFGDWDVT
jgi:6-phosphogluconate dehydrogenase